LRIPRVAFVVQLENSFEHPADQARLHHLLQLLEGQKIPVTWSLAISATWNGLVVNSLRPDDEYAIGWRTEHPATGITTTSFRETLRRELVALGQQGIQRVSYLAGNPQSFRPHAAILGEQGIRAVLDTSGAKRHSVSPVPLPCGLWQLAFAREIPQRITWLSWLSFQPRLERAIHQHSGETAMFLILIRAAELARGTARALRGLESLLELVAHRASRQELELATVGQWVAELSAKRGARPQHSILRAA
jgi:hypothetical protein